MDIQQLYYFMNIVECGCNLSLAAKKIHITQSALSQLIINFEANEELTLFYRKNGRLESLTPSGEKLYTYAQEITQLHEQMNEMVRKEAAKQKGTIRIGLPSLILRIFFSSFFPKLMMDNPNIQLEIVEGGSNYLRKMLFQNDLDYAILIEPTSLDPKSFEEHVIQIDEMTAFVYHTHPLAHKKRLSWRDLESFPVATFNESFTTYELVTEKLKKEKSNAQIKLTSSSWDYLVEATQESNIVAVLPSPIERTMDKNLFVEIPFKEPIPFNVLLCRPIKGNYNDVEGLVYESILSYFYQPIVE
ncbi:LysR family transcriptional regulator [Vagococcus xieshaowenii]|uniref:LysR family transcriptional regulator n=1 Tax=Vagococcus xieshaowenii TaxID=2562451 RepID=A0AAJ5EDJ2_9ENTE|nr:LysR family transcriptional regulator [Vagococcus xieshaowenii]QCA28103.1 LysR family transcriptional regulator [Vagococcus xieshaowenii]TFZ40146.1 LysR family transcriptional regulator [Vagococcus xieshaowenii]